MLEAILRHLNNWFLVPGGVHAGTYEIKGGGIALPFLQEGQYYRVCGSVFNDGLHQYSAPDLTDETFSGTIWALAIPAAVVALANEIAAWQEKNGEAVASPYQSESFGGYSYTKGGSGNGSDSWQSVFRSRLNDWRKMKGVEP